MGDLGTFLRFVSRIRLLSNIGATAALAVGIMILVGNFDSTLSVVLGIVSGIVLVASVGGLIYARNLVKELEESFRSESAEITAEQGN